MLSFKAIHLQYIHNGNARRGFTIKIWTTDIKPWDKPEYIKIQNAVSLCHTFIILQLYYAFNIIS